MKASSYPPRNTSETEGWLRATNTIYEKYIVRESILDNLPFEEITSRIDCYSSVMLFDIDVKLRERLLIYCFSKGKRVYMLPNTAEILNNNAYNIQISDSPILLYKNNCLTIEQELIKRFMDLILSLIGLVLFSPIMLICALLIKLYDGGPIFFKQVRVTKGNKKFVLIKFRSMLVDAEKDGAQKSTKNDDRITPIGKIIRTLRIDETPQFFNVLQGVMSIVGPRPERVENVEEYSKLVPEFNLRHKVKAGLTGYAQVYGKYNTTPKDKLNMDLLYIQQYSILNDIKYILLTIKIIFMRKSTEGFD